MLLNILTIQIYGHCLVSWMFVGLVFATILFPGVFKAFTYINTSTYVPKHKCEIDSSINYLAYRTAEANGDYNVAGIERQKYWKNR